VIDKGLPGPGLVAYVATSKYADHLPLYRLEGIFARHGVQISRSTMCAWMMAAAQLLVPLVRLMADRIRTSRVIHTDDSATRKRLAHSVGDKPTGAKAKAP
jgi:transposase